MEDFFAGGGDLARAGPTAGSGRTCAHSLTSLCGWGRDGGGGGGELLITRQRRKSRADRHRPHAGTGRGRLTEGETRAARAADPAARHALRAIWEAGDGPGARPRAPRDLPSEHA